MVIKGGIGGQPGNAKDNTDEGVFISKINPGGCASRNQDKLVVGQRIIEVNGQSLLGASHSEAVAALRNSGNTIHLLLCDGWNNPASGQLAIQNGSEQDRQQGEAEQPPRPPSAQEEVSFFPKVIWTPNCDCSFCFRS